MENNDKKYCSICKGEAPEDASILTVGRLGYPRYLCEECDRLLADATTEKTYEAISRAFDDLGARIAAGNIDDEIVSDAITEILGKARERAEAIKDGSYDFALDPNEEMAEDEDEAEDAVECDSEGLPFGAEEELTEEEIAKREKSEKVAAKVNTITNWACAAIFLGVLGYCIWKIFFS